MAIKIYEKFAPRANPADGDYPYGSIKNESVPGAKDGTPLDAVWANDYAGTDAELFAQAGTVPSGQPDKIGASQRVDALNKLFARVNFNSVAEISASSASLTDGMVIVAKGHYSLNDGGAGTWIVSYGAPVEAYDFDIGNGLHISPLNTTEIDAGMMGFTKLNPNVTKLNSVIAAAHPVVVKKGIYRPKAPIRFPRGKLIGSGMQDCIIMPDYTLGAFPVVDFMEEGFPNGANLSGFFIDGRVGDNLPVVGSRGINLELLNTGGDPLHWYPGQSIISQIQIYGLDRGIVDFCGHYMSRYENITVRDCNTSINKSGGTTIIMSNVYAYDCKEGISVDNCLNVTLLQCAADGVNSVDETTFALKVTNCRTVSVDGWDSEACTVRDNGQLALIRGNNVVNIDGFTTWSCSIGGGIGHASIVKVDANANCNYSGDTVSTTVAAGNSQEVTSFRSINSSASVSNSVLNFTNPDVNTNCIHNAGLLEVQYSGYEAMISKSVGLISCQGIKKGNYTVVPVVVPANSQVLLVTLVDNKAKVGDVYSSEFDIPQPQLLSRVVCESDGVAFVYAVNFSTTNSTVSGRIYYERQKTILDYTV